jgi:hypothetical protein
MASASDFPDGSPKPKIRHLCKNMQKAVQGTASCLLAFIGLRGHAAMNMTSTSDFPNGNPKLKMHHLCKNVQKAEQGTTSCLLAFIGLWGPLLVITAPCPSIQITTTSPASHKFVTLPVVEPVQGSPWAACQGITI